MPNVSVYNQTGSQVGTIALSDAIFAVKPDQAIIHEAMVAQRANARRAIANTKTRGEVRGGGKKPWKQKGTGRARQGSIRSPQWVGGGITFGPTSERNFSLKINKKVKRKALFMALSDKVLSQKFMVLESMDTSSAKTKQAASVIAKLPIDRNVLLVV
jgi:large subunit ribosomal protein L4